MTRSHKSVGVTQTGRGSRPFFSGFLAPFATTRPRFYWFLFFLSRLLLYSKTRHCKRRVENRRSEAAAGGANVALGNLPSRCALACVAQTCTRLRVASRTQRRAGALGLLLINEAAKLLGVSEMTLRRWDRVGKFKARRHPMNGYRVYRREDLLALRQRLRSGAR